jgi:hypothetical protein
MQECDTVMEFLSNPWVLVQVAHFPTVLYQWLMAATAEVLRYEQQISDFQFLPYPEIWESMVDRFTAEIYGFAMFIDLGFEELQDLIFEHDNPTEFQSTFGESFGTKDLETLMSRLMKFRSENGLHFINFFKRFSWNKPNETFNVTLVRPTTTHPMCAFKSHKRHFRKINAASGLTGSLMFSAKDIQSCATQECDCEECSKMYREIRKERMDFFKSLTDSKSKDPMQTMMIKFFDDHLKERFPSMKMNKSILAHLVNKEMLYLQSKFIAIEGRNNIF